MTEQKLLNALGDIDLVLIEDAAPRSDRPFRRKLFYSITGVAACLALIVTVGSMTGLWKTLFGPNTMPDVLPNDHPNYEGAIIMPVPWKDMVAGNVGADTSDALYDWFGFEVSYDLYEALNRSENDDKYFALTISRHGYGKEDFVYASMTVADYEQFRKSIDGKRDYRWNKLHQFEKTGLWLCWGEILYTTGIPSDVPIVGGDKWAEELYLREVEFFGQDLIDTYTNGHTLLLDQLQADGIALEAEIAADEQLAEEWRQAYARSENYQTFNDLLDKGYYVYHFKHLTYLFITKDQLKNMDIDHDEYSLNFAYRNPLEGQPEENVPTDEPDVEPDVPLPDVVE